MWIKYDPTDKCVKCGRDGSNHDLELLAPVNEQTFGSTPYLLPERFKVTCRKCNHRWHRLPLDADVKAANQGLQ